MPVEEVTTPNGELHKPFYKKTTFWINVAIILAAAWLKSTGAITEESWVQLTALGGGGYTLKELVLKIAVAISEMKKNGGNGET